MGDDGGAGGPGSLDVDGYVADPAAELARLAGEHWYATGFDLSGRPMPMVLAYDHVRTTLRDRRLSSRSFTDDMRASGISETTAHQLTPLFRRHGDEHKHHRALLAAAFTPRSVERLRPVAAATAGRLAHELAVASDEAGGGWTDLVPAFAAPLPPEVFAVLFGLPVSDRDRLGRWASAVAKAFILANGPDDVAEIEAAAAELRDYGRDLIADRRARPADDLVTGLLAAEIDGQRLDDDEIVATISGFIFAGAETTRNQLMELVVAFARRPDAWRRVQADADLVPGAVEEVLRHRGIVPGLTRVAVEPFEDAELEVERDGRLLVSFAAANHDAAHFEDPGSFVIDRANASEHLSFGWGPHFCLGAGLARVELQESLLALTARFAPPEIDPARLAMDHGWADSLPVRWSSRST
jgi:cytochrome P450